MEVAERVRELVAALPQGASVTLSREVLARWLEDGADDAERATEHPVADLTVGDIAEAHQKAESTVRGWMSDVPGAYRLGNEWRVPRRAWRDYLDALADDGDDGPPEVRSRPSSDLEGWREAS